MKLSFLSYGSMRVAAIATAIAFLATATGIVSFVSFVSAEVGGPAVVLTSTVGSSTNAATVSVTATFSDDVLGFTADDISVTNGTASNLATTTADSVYSFDITPSSDGAVTVQVPADVASSTTTNLGNLESNEFAFDADATGPTISNIQATTTATTATVTWDTDEAATSSLAFGTTTSYGETSTTTSAGTSHSVTLTSLDPDTMYHFQVQAQDAAGNTATSSDQTFATGEEPVVIPAITNLTVGTTSTSSVTITWDTDIPATTQVNYGTTTSFGLSSDYDDTLTTSHSVMLMMLDEGTQYFFEAASSNAAGTTTATSTFTTSSTASSTPLAVDEIESVDSEGVADNLFADGWKWIIRFTVPDNEDAFRIRFSDWGNATTSFPAEGNIRLSIAESDNASTTDLGFIVEGNDYSDWFNLSGDDSATEPGRQINLTVEVKIPFGTPTGSYSSNFTAQTFPQSATSTAP